MKPLLLSLLAGLGLIAAAQAQAQTSYVSCDVQTIFQKPYAHDTQWVHMENKYTKIFKIDAGAKMVSVWNNRNNIFTPICSATNASCKTDWGSDHISVDATAAPDSPVGDYLDFRRSVAFTDNLTKVVHVIGDYGQATGGKPNMTWTYEGNCAPTTAPVAVPFMPPAASGAKRPGNPLYQAATGPAQPVSKAEAAKVIGPYVGNTMTGYSGGGHWFHMWFFKADPVLAYTSDDYDISSEGKPRAWWVGKDSTGYRLCPTVDVANNTGMKMQPGVNCYPLLIKKVGDVWVEHDMDGDAYFSMFAGRQ